MGQSSFLNHSDDNLKENQGRGAKIFHKFLIIVYLLVIILSWTEVLVIVSKDVGFKIFLTVFFGYFILQSLHKVLIGIDRKRRR